MSWSGWFDIGMPTGGFQGGPATVSRSKDVCNLYAWGADNRLWQRGFVGGRWHDWVSHGDGTLASEPAVGSMGPDHEHVFIRGTDGKVYHKYWTRQGGWKGWFDIGAPSGGFAGAPATVARNKDVCNVYVRGNDNRLWQRGYTGGQWHDWVCHGDGVLASEPAVGSMGPDHEHVFIRGTDGKVYHKYWTRQGGWKGWFDIGAPSGGFAGAPATVARNKDVCNVYVRGNDNRLWQRGYDDGRWHGWVSHGDGVLASRPAVGSMRPDHEHVFIRGTNGKVYHKYWEATVDPEGEVSFDVSECTFGWTAAYRQSGTRVAVRIQLNPDDGISTATMDTLRTTWRDGIIATWSDRFHCRAPNGGRQSLTFDVQWVTSGAHHVVRVQPGPARSNMATWDTLDTGNVAAHEFGHMLGHPDEYADRVCPGRSPVNTGTVMDDNTETVARLYDRICGFHGSGHAPVAAGTPEPGTPGTGGIRMTLIDSLTPDRRGAVLGRLRAAAEGDRTLEDAGSAQVAFEVSGGAPGERYAYALAVHADGSVERTVVDELSTEGPSEPGAGDLSGTVAADLVADVFAAAQEVGLLDDAAPSLAPDDARLVPDSLVAILTVRDGDAVRRVVVPAAEPGTTAEPATAGRPTAAGEPLSDDVSDVPLETSMQLATESVTRLGPVLAALRAVEAAL